MKIKKIKLNRYIYAIAIVIIIASIAVFFRTRFFFQKDLFPPPPMGWNGWNVFRCDNATEKNIFDAVDALISSGMRDVGYEYVNIDDCWQKERSTDGAIVVDEEHFPHGMKYVADYIHNKGLLFGIYTSAGRQTCEGRPGSFGYEAKDMATYAAWGVDYVKVDWCGMDGLSAPIQFSLWHSLIQRAPRPMKLSIGMPNIGVDQPWVWGAYVSDIWRVNNDIQDNWDSVVSIIDMNTPLASYSGLGHWNDPDMLVVGLGNLTPNEYAAHFGMWAMMHAPLIAGNDLMKMDVNTRDLLTNNELIAIDQDALGTQGERMFAREGYEVWAKPLHYPWERAIAILNRTNENKVISFSWKEAGVLFPLLARDVIHKQWVWMPSRVSVSLPPHGIHLWRIAGLFPPHPFVHWRPNMPILTGFLSDQKWVYVINGYGSVERNMSNGNESTHDGLPLSIRGILYPKGLGVHAYSLVMFNVYKQCQQLRAVVGIDDEVTSGDPSVIFVVYGDGKALFTSAPVNRYTSPPPLLANINDVDTLILEVKSADPNTIDYEHADWANLHITCR